MYRPQEEKEFEETVIEIKRVSKKTPKTAKELGPKKLAQKQKEKRRVGMGKRVKKS